MANKVCINTDDILTHLPELENQGNQDIASKSGVSVNVFQMMYILLAIFWRLHVDYSVTKSFQVCLDLCYPFNIDEGNKPQKS